MMEIENLDALLGENSLATLQLYRFIYPDGHNFTIALHEVITGPNKGEFMARPEAILKFAKDKYCGRGQSGQEALEDCLKRIKGKEQDEIFKELGT